jgi:hypothetical protein
MKSRSVEPSTSTIRDSLLYLGEQESRIDEGVVEIENLVKKPRDFFLVV